jgi:hypothetical protein
MACENEFDPPLTDVKLIRVIYTYYKIINWGINARPGFDVLKYNTPPFGNL